MNSRRIMMRLLPRKNIGLLLAGMAGVGIVGFATYVTGGMAFRVPKEVLAFSITGEETSKFWRRGECLLLPEQGAKSFAADCMASGGEHRRILLWGDSYAAAVAQGFVQLAKTHHYSVGWLTSSACPPLIGFVHPERPFCKENNDWVMQTIQKTHPDIVILHATWSYSPPDIEKGLVRTVSDLRAAGVKKIVLMGPVATWSGIGLSSNFTEFSLHASSLMPKYSFYRSNHKHDEATDQALRKQATSLGILYVSPFNAMCNPQGCLARTGDHDQYLTAFDNGHMTVPGATSVVQKLLPEILE